MISKLKRAYYWNIHAEYYHMSMGDLIGLERHPCMFMCILESVRYSTALSNQANGLEGVGYSLHGRSRAWLSLPMQ